jgi:hypothetical protein
MSHEEWDLSKEEDIAMIFGFAHEQVAEARWFHVWSREVVEGKDQRAQQVDVELLHRESHLP